MGVEVLKFVQYGLESAHGTPVAADTKLGVMVGLPESDREMHVPRVEMGTRMAERLDAAIVKRIIADGISMEDADGLYFELLPVL